MDFTTRTKLFIVLTATFVTCLVVGDLIGGKLTEVTILGTVFTISLGMLPFPVTFLLTDLLNEFYGAQAARFVTWAGFAMAALCYLVVTTAVSVPIAGFTYASDWSGVTQQAFANVLAGSQRILLASMVAYVVAQLIDIAIFHALKRASKGSQLWLRATGSTLISQLIDTCVIQAVAWWGILPAARIVNIAASSYAVKVAVAISLTPLIYAGHALLERWLHLQPEPVETTEQLPIGSP